MRTDKRSRCLAWVLLTILGLTVGRAIAADDEKTPEYSRKGADTCLKCHDEDNEYPVMPIFRSGHGETLDARSPMAILQCETCHGPAGDHPKRVREGEQRPPIRAFGREAWTPLAEQNAVCLRCHDDTRRSYWHGGAHESADVGCADCHRAHSRRDPMTDPRDQVATCNACHLQQKAEFSRRSSHPVRFGRMACGDLCLRCHTEKRGPVLWPHAPVIEDCTLCHGAHGSVQAALLKKRPPLLCQQCHNNAGHPAALYTGDGLPGGGAAGQRKFLRGKSCLNCHSQVHGSNHPSGVKLMR